MSEQLNEIDVVLKTTDEYFNTHWVSKTTTLITSTGTKYDEIAKKLAVPFDNPEKAYKEISGGRGGRAGLTDISTGFLIERLTEVFGLRGIGWDLEYDVNDLVLNGDLTGFDAVGFLKKAYFVFPLYEETSGELVTTVRILTDGLSKNDPAFALEGARTKAIGQAVKWLCFQLPVYQDMITALPTKPEPTSTNKRSTTRKPPANSTAKKAPANSTTNKAPEKKDAPAKSNGSKEKKTPAVSYSTATYEKAGAYKTPAGLPNEGLPLIDLFTASRGLIVLQYLAGKIASPEAKVFYNTVENYDEKLEQAANYILTYEKQYKAEATK